MAASKADVLGGSAAKSVTLEAAVFGAELKRHIVHEVVRAELNAHRAGTRGAKTRGLVSGGRAKPWRQKGTGRARQGTIRAPQFTGGGVAFAPGMRSFDVKVNRKARRAALAGALSNHVGNETLALVDGTRLRDAVDEAGQGARRDVGQGRRRSSSSRTRTRSALIKSFRNLDRVLVTVPVRARGRADRLGALGARQRGRAPARRREGIVNPADVLLAPVVSEKSYSGSPTASTRSRCTRTPTRRRCARPSSSCSSVKVASVHIDQGAGEAEAARRRTRASARAGRRPSCSCTRASTIEIFEGAQV